MRKNHKSNRPKASDGKNRIRLQFKRPHARSVFVAGTFNDWTPDLILLQKGDDGCWSTELQLLPGVYEYRFVVDGEWVNDPQAAIEVPNPYGGSNSVLLVSSQEQALR